MSNKDMTASQARAARAMLSWSIEQLARKSKISTSSIRRIETGFGKPEGVTLDLLVRMQNYFEGRGFTFTWQNDTGVGVHWRRNGSRAARRAV